MNQLHTWPRQGIHQRPHHKPLRTKAELAEEFGLKNVMALAQRMRRSSVPVPKPRFRAMTSGDWYDHDEMRAWWKADEAARREIHATA